LYDLPADIDLGGAHVRLHGHPADRTHYPGHYPEDLHALAILSISNDRQDGFRTSRVYEIYENICNGQGSDTLSLRRVHDLLKEHAFLDIIEQSKHSGGSAEGSYTKHQLLEDPTVVKDVLSEDVA
jgi:cell division control protein 6